MTDVALSRTGVLWEPEHPRQERRDRSRLSRDRSEGMRAWQSEDRGLTLPAGSGRKQRAETGLVAERRDREWHALDSCRRPPLQPSGTTRPPTVVVAHRHRWVSHRLPALLRAAGVLVLSAEQDAALAIALVVLEQPDVVLLSEHLAGQRGLDVASRVRRLAPHTAVAVQLEVPSSAGEFRPVSEALYTRTCDLTTITESIGRLIPT